jgi:hypothetical protein
VLPQPSWGFPHVALREAQVEGLHVHIPSVHVLLDPAGQVPHMSEPPQPSDAVPHMMPRAPHVVGVQPQTLATGGLPAPHICGAGHLGHA